jgi:hypothetical protein
LSNICKVNLKICNFISALYNLQINGGKSPQTTDPYWRGRSRFLIQRF